MADKFAFKPFQMPDRTNHSKAVGLHMILISPIWFYSAKYEHGSWTLCCYVNALPKVMRVLRDHEGCQFDQCIDISATEYPNRADPYEVVYHLLSTHFASRIRIKVRVDDWTPVHSICHLYPGANWYEREVWDMLGVFIQGHPDLRRILTDYGFEGHPLRKGFPISGYTEVR